MTYDLVVVGAGVTGALLAYKLAGRGLRILVIDEAPDVSMGASKANSGIIHGGYAESMGLRASLCYPGRLQFATLNRSLAFGFRETGSLVLARTAQEEDELDRLLEQGRNNGLEDLRILRRSEVLAREPGVDSKVVAALLCTGAGVASPYRLVIRALESAIARRVELRLNCRVIGVEGEGGRLRVFLKAPGSRITRTIRASWLVNAAGSGAQTLAEEFGDFSIDLRFRKGEYLLFGSGSGSLVRGVLFGVPVPSGKGVVVSSTVDGNLLVGPDARQVDDTVDSSTDLKALASILERGRQLLPGIQVRQFVRSFAGVRAISAGGDFILEPSTVIPRVIHAAGIQSPGLTASPAIADHLIAILGMGTGFTANPLPPQNSEAFPRLAPAELRTAQDLPLGDPRRIVCRCEQIREAQIVECLNRGIPVRTLDGVKRRTRAGMGWCQGDFCRPRVAEILLRRYGEDSELRLVEDREAAGSQRYSRSQIISVLESVPEPEGESPRN